MNKQTKKTKVAHKPLSKSSGVRPVRPKGFVEDTKPAAARPGANMQNGPSKTFQQDGHWIEKPNKTAILICVCGNRYLKTRPRQEKCLRCVSAVLTRR